MCQKPISFLQCWFPFFRLRTFLTLSPRGTQPEREAKCHTHLTTSFIWEELLIVKATSKILSKLQFQRPSSFRDPSVQKYISKLIKKQSHTTRKELFDWFGMYSHQFQLFSETGPPLPWKSGGMESMPTGGKKSLNNLKLATWTLANPQKIQEDNKSQGWGTWDSTSFTGSLWDPRVSSCWHMAHK